METLGQRIKRLRMKKNLSQDELAKMMGYSSRSTINKIEMDINSVSHNKLLRFADMLGTSPAYMLTGDADADVNTIRIVTLDGMEISGTLSDKEVSRIIGLLADIEEKRKGE